MVLGSHPPSAFHQLLQTLEDVLLDLPPQVSQLPQVISAEALITGAGPPALPATDEREISVHRAAGIGPGS